MSINLPRNPIRKIAAKSEASSENFNATFREIDDNFEEVENHLNGLNSKIGQNKSELEQDINTLQTNLTGTKDRLISNTITNVMTQGSVSISNTVRTKGFAIETYTGQTPSDNLTDNGDGTWTLKTGIASEDFTKPNSSGYYFERDKSGSAVISSNSPNLVSNGSFSSGKTDGWDSHSSTLSIDAGRLKVTNSGGRYATFQISAEIDQLYKVHSDMSDGTGTGWLWITESPDIVNGHLLELKASHSDGGTFKATKNILYITLLSGGQSGQYSFFNNISVRKAEKSGSCRVNLSKVHIKCLSAIRNNSNVDGLRGYTKFVSSNLTAQESNQLNLVKSSTSNGVILGTNDEANESGQTYILYQTLYTHIKWGLTNHNKFFVTAYNPVTKECMIYYEGSGITGHRLSHYLEQKPGFWVHKRLDTVSIWEVHGSVFGRMKLNSTEANSGNTQYPVNSYDDAIIISNTDTDWNASSGVYIMYGKAPSENWNIFQYQGTGKAGNFIETRDVNGVLKRPGRVIIKGTSVPGSWYVFDSERIGYHLLLNASDTQVLRNHITIQDTGFIFNTDSVGLNSAGAQGIALVEFATGDGTGDSWFDKATENTKLSFNNILANYTGGLDDNGYQNGSERLNMEATLPNKDGLHYVARNRSTRQFELFKHPLSYDAPTGDAWQDNNKVFFDKTTGITTQKKFSGFGDTKDTLDIFGDGSCIACYPLRGDANDLSGNFNGTPTNMTWLKSGRFAGAGYFGGSSYITATSPIPSGKSPKSFSTTYIHSSENTAWIIGGGTDSPGNAFGLFIAGSRISFHGQTGEYDMHFAYNLIPGNEYFVVISYDGTQVTAYINGVRKASKIVELNTTGAVLRIGCRNNLSLNAKGEIKQTRFFNKSLSDKEVKQLYYESLSLKDNSETKVLSFLPNPVHLANGIPQSIDKTTSLPEIVLPSLKVLGAFDLGQKRINMIEERDPHIWYKNDTGKPIEINVIVQAVNVSEHVFAVLYIKGYNGEVIRQYGKGDNVRTEALTINGQILPGEEYMINSIESKIEGWSEIR